MAENSSIEWTGDTDNIIVVKSGGWWCRMISPGCANCYAAKLNQSAFFGGNKLAYRGEPPELLLREDIIDSWKRQTRSRKHFVASMTDVFGDWVSQDWCNRFLRGMRCAPKQTFQVLTKRPDVAAERIKAWLAFDGLTELPPNIWIGTSVEDQARADERIAHLMTIPATVRFLSCEPLLGPVVLRHAVDWVIVGGESGPNARPMHPAWVDFLKRQCLLAGVPFFFKQWGEWGDASHGMKIHDSHRFPESGPMAGDSRIVYRVGKKAAGRLLDGHEHNEFPVATIQTP